MIPVHAPSGSERVLFSFQLSRISKIIKYSYKIRQLASINSEIKAPRQQKVASAKPTMRALMI